MDDLILKIPKNIKKIIENKTYDFDEIGMSGSKILLFEDYVLKIEPYKKSNDLTCEVMKWLEDKIPVPKIISYEIKNGFSFLLMTKVQGEMSCDEKYLENPEILLKILSESLKKLWSVDVTDCPRCRDINTELKEAKFRIDNDLVDLDNVEPDTFGENGFKSPIELLKWLEENKPSYEPVLSHGDFCLPNILIKNNQLSGFIDLGDTGIGDKWRDIALCYRSLKNNFNGSFGGKIYHDFNPDLLFDYLEIKPNYDKLKYYMLLDELF